MLCVCMDAKSDLYAKKAPRADREAVGLQDRNGSSSSYTAHFSTASEVLLRTLLLLDTMYNLVPCEAFLRILSKL